MQGPRINWGTDDTSCREIPIFNASILLADPNLLQFVIMDMSGSDGIGFHSLRAHHWRVDEIFRSSVDGELLAFLDCRRRSVIFIIRPRATASSSGPLIIVRYFVDDVILLLLRQSIVV